MYRLLDPQTHTLLEVLKTRQLNPAIHAAQIYANRHNTPAMLVKATKNGIRLIGTYYYINGVLR